MASFVHAIMFTMTTSLVHAIMSTMATWIMPAIEYNYLDHPPLCKDYGHFTKSKARSRDNMRWIWKADEHQLYLHNDEISFGSNWKNSYTTFVQPFCQKSQSKQQFTATIEGETALQVHVVSQKAMPINT